MKEIKTIKDIECSTGVITLRSDKILTYKSFEHITTCNMEQAKEMLDIFIKLTNGVPHLFFFDNTNMTKLGPEERIFVTDTLHQFAIANAIKENSPLTRFVTHAMMYLNKPQVPIKMFKTEESAINWLKSL